MRVKDFFVDFSKKVDALQTLQKTKFVVLTQLSGGGQKSLRRFYYSVLI
jgi:hypothetical protein